MSDTSGLDAIADLIKQAYEPYIAASLKPHSLFTPDPAVVERKRRQHGERKTRNRARWQKVRDWAYDQPVIDLVALHEPDDYTEYQRACQGCQSEVSGYEYDIEDWPCQSFLIMEKAMVDRSGY